jgi:hypothetical protein
MTEYLLQLTVIHSRKDGQPGTMRTAIGLPRATASKQHAVAGNQLEEISENACAQERSGCLQHCSDREKETPDNHSA